MTSASSQTPSPKEKSPAQGNNLLRVVLFLVLGYLILAMAYDFLYVFKTHKETFKALEQKITDEATRSADDVKAKGPFGPQEVQEFIGFAPSVPLEEKGHYAHERYSYRRGLLFQTLNLDVYYKKIGDKLAVTSVAHTDEDIAEATPQPPAVPGPIIEDTPSEKTEQLSGESTDDSKKAASSEDASPDEKSGEAKKDASSESSDEASK